MVGETVGSSLGAAGSLLKGADPLPGIGLEIPIFPCQNAIPWREGPGPSS